MDDLVVKQGGVEIIVDIDAAELSSYDNDFIEVAYLQANWEIVQFYGLQVLVMKDYHMFFVVSKNYFE